MRHANLKHELFLPQWLKYTLHVFSVHKKDAYTRVFL